VLGVVLIQRAPIFPRVVGLVVTLALLTLVVGVVFRRSALVAWSIVLLGTAYGFSIIGEPVSVDAVSLLVAATIFLAAEAGYLAVEEEILIAPPVRRALSSLAVAVGSAIIGVILLAIGESLLNAGPLLTAGGIAATLVLLAVVITAAARRTAG
jgi:hypothetical protein